MIILDQLKRELRLDQIPKRIVSLVPSQTELLVDLGLEKNIVGVTKFCVHPKDLRKSTTVVGGTKEVNYEKIRALNPDIILCNKEENTPEMVRELEKITTVYVSDIVCLDDAVVVILQFGEIFNVSDKAGALVEKFQDDLSQFRSYPKPPRTVVYFIWREP
ncbi:MAG TPA: helical backbone metal receptor, partial [Gillisia sp.]|nr:helical backbone metal receptor [Gillisia sp.]